MYKTVFIEHAKGGYEIQCGKTQILDDTINKWNENGYELASITPCPYLVNAGRCGFILVFKSKN